MELDLHTAYLFLYSFSLGQQRQFVALPAETGRKVYLVSARQLTGLTKVTGLTKGTGLTKVTGLTKGTGLTDALTGLTRVRPLTPRRTRAASMT